MTDRSHLPPRWPYTPDERDRVVSLDGAPQSDVGAPLPVVLASENRVFLIYLVQETPADWDGSWVQSVDGDSPDMPVAVIEFTRTAAHIFGPPNNEAFSGHPLKDRGLRPYSASTIQDSSWIRALERMNSVHERHLPERFWELTHYVFAFHDCTFECVAQRFTASTHRDPLRAVIATMAARLA